MILADRWTDYELLDCGDGLKKERWGDVVLVRPDPQAIWPLASGDWGEADAFYRRSRQGGGRWEFRRPLPESWSIGYRDLRFKIRPTSFKHTGLFPEQAVNWDWCRERIQRRGGQPSLLNLFAYTGAATVSAAKAEASVCHVDASKGMVSWCRENARLCGLEQAPIRYLVDDCMKFVERERRRGSRYDAIVMDPPSYGRGRKGEVWRLEKDLYTLLAACEGLLSPEPLFFLVNAYTAGLSPTVVGNLLRHTLARRGGRVESGEIGLPATQSEQVLPCGLYARWEPA